MVFEEDIQVCSGDWGENRLYEVPFESLLLQPGLPPLLHLGEFLGLSADHLSRQLLESGLSLGGDRADWVGCSRNIYS